MNEPFRSLLPLWEKVRACPEPVEGMRGIGAQRQQCNRHTLEQFAPHYSH